jgi:regulator of RNase E activity RraB
MLEKNGDKLTNARPVSHWAYFATPVDRKAFLVEATRRGFTITDDSTGTGEPSRRPCGVTLEKVHSIDKIDDVTIELFRLALLHDGEYDGWETSVQKTS